MVRQKKPSNIKRKIEELTRFVKNVGTRGLHEDVYITVGMEMFGFRGIHPLLAKPMFSVMKEFPKYSFILLLDGAVPDNIDVPSNCVLGVNVKTASQLELIEDVINSNARQTMLSLADLEEPLDFEDIPIEGIDIVVLSGNDQYEIQEWEEQFIDYVEISYDSIPQIVDRCNILIHDSSYDGMINVIKFL